MVAITVILAAVIASFVLGLGGTAGDAAPQPTITVDSTDEGEVTLSLTGGDSLEFDDLLLRGAGIDDETTADDASEDGLEDETWNVGDSVTFDDTSWEDEGDDVNIVWVDGDNEEILFTFGAPPPSS